MRTRVSVGDTYNLGERTMAVVEVKTATDGNGVVLFDEADVTVVVKLLDDRPLVATGDDYFACYLLRDTADATQHAVGVYHPTLGERIQPATPQVPPFTEELVMCWAPLSVQVLVEGQPAAGDSVDLLLERATADGTARLLLPDKYRVLTWSDDWGALVDSGQRERVYKTDDQGYVSNAVLDEPILLPRGQGAWGQRAEDLLYDGATPPEEYVARALVYYRGQSAEMREGEATVIDWRTGTVVVNGPADAWVSVELEDFFESPTGVTTTVKDQIPASGQLTASGLYPGHYCVSMWQAGSGQDQRDWSVICPRQWVDLGAGETATVTMAFEAPPTGYEVAYVYAAGALGASGVDVWGMTFSGYEVVGTADGSGRVQIPANPAPANMLVNDSYWGWQVLRGEGPTYEATLGGYVGLALSMGFSGQGGWFAFPGTSHDHLGDTQPGWRVHVVQTGDIYDFGPIPIGARTADPVPHLPAGTLAQMSFTAPTQTYDILLEDADGNLIKTLQTASTPDRTGLDAGTLDMEIVGGKPWGDVLLHAPDQSTVPGLPEAARIGLEHGELGPAALLRLVPASGSEDAHEGRLGWVCPYCLCMTYLWPGTGYGYCPQCGADARSYLHGPPAPEGRWQTRYVATGPGGAQVDVPAGYWYRPLAYAETDTYLRMYEGLPRWVCEHPLLGQWQAGTWTAGTDATTLEQTWCQDGDRLLVRPKLEIVGQVAGDASYRLRYRTDAGDLDHVDFDLKAGDEGIKLLSGLAPVWAEVRDPAEALFVAAVTSVELLDPAEDPGNNFQVVGDAPSLVLAALPILHAAATPLALQIGPLTVTSGPDLRQTADGRIFVAYVSDGDIYVAQRPSPQRPWGTAVRVTEGGHYTDPSLATGPTGALVLAYTDVGGELQKMAVSKNDGETWGEL